MGTPLPENPVGVACPNCWGSGKPFGLESTPEILVVQLFDLQEGVFWDPAVAVAALFPTQLFQTDQPCIWFAESSTITWELFLLPADTVLFVNAVEDERPIFNMINSSPCVTSGENDINLPVGVFAFGGTFKLTFSEVFS